MVDEPSVKYKSWAEIEERYRLQKAAKAKDDSTQWTMDTVLAMQVYRIVWEYETYRHTSKALKPMSISQWLFKTQERHIILSNKRMLELADVAMSGWYDHKLWTLSINRLNVHPIIRGLPKAHLSEHGIAFKP